MIFHQAPAPLYKKISRFGVLDITQGRGTQRRFLPKYVDTFRLESMVLLDL